MTPARFILASKSAARREVLTNAGVTFEVQVAGVDEDALKTPGVDPRQLAIDLAKAKALAVSAQHPDAVVLGADQTLAFDGGLVSKALNLDQAKARLASMRGLPHQLHSGVALAQGGEILWADADTAHMVVRDFSDAFLDAYIAHEGDELLHCVGSYRLEGMGSQLFDKVDGDYFTVLGMPLWLVLDKLREFKVLPE
ncbi:Maf family protein [Brevundimonas pishanensis]|uniref:Maf family protein n=1 Tax=Brevundimonas pishanensis TaxID=2896315 RepID=UPI001FA7C5F5|nr:nucleoside triphosphate pyrophosphatase [Brevundimonas pishanensis]